MPKNYGSPSQIATPKSIKNIHYWPLEEKIPDEGHITKPQTTNILAVTQERLSTTNRTLANSSKSDSRRSSMGSID